MCAAPPSQQHGHCIGMALPVVWLEAMPDAVGDPACGAVHVHVDVTRACTERVVAAADHDVPTLPSPVVVPLWLRRRTGHG